MKNKYIGKWDKYSPLILGTLAFIVGFLFILALSILNSVVVAAKHVRHEMADFANEAWVENFQKWKSKHTGRSCQGDN